MKHTAIILILLQCCLALKTNSTILHKYESIFNFGDSLSDTGNFIRSVAGLPVVPKFPYGKTYFGHPTGRFSDGRLIIDFIAEAVGLPHLKPYLEVVNNGSIDARRGVNFAVAGATALDPTFFATRKIRTFTMTNNSLSVQLDWFKKLKSSLCTTQQDCKTYFKKSLFLVGEIGGNDYNFAFANGANFEQLRPIVPIVVGAITNATSMLIEDGAVELVVPGILPMGCMTSYIATSPLLDKDDVNTTTSCLNRYNEFARYHNGYLQQELQHLRQKHSHARIIYADYYGDSMRLFESPKQYGFSKLIQVACCGAGGPLNFNVSMMCGSSSHTCTDPSAFIQWDGVHLTEAAYRHMATGLLDGPFTSPRLVA
ncbi:GDSL esterase/lipase At5g45910-like [Rhodamnia argentea]|uniref:GDSL esterase/lipase At5g45910-like n=1 Tax=Rhodamnia argentea TaxID=178133 RepID=A0A8B8N393_9MYRT|nr:GDSL esterase/lipase At5g45910-like [Rhodamnia argentea]